MIYIYIYIRLNPCDKYRQRKHPSGGNIMPGNPRNNINIE